MRPLGSAATAVPSSVPPKSVTSNPPLPKLESRSPAAAEAAATRTPARARATSIVHQRCILRRISLLARSVALFQRRVNPPTHAASATTASAGATSETPSRRPRGYSARKGRYDVRSMAPAEGRSSRRHAVRFSAERCLAAVQLWYAFVRELWRSAAPIDGRALAIEKAASGATGPSGLTFHWPEALTTVVDRPSFTWKTWSGATDEMASPALRSPSHQGALATATWRAGRLPNS